MNTSGEVADLMVKEGIQVTESALKLVGLGAKNLAAIIIALVNEDTKLQGKTNLKQLLKSDKPLCILQIKAEDLKKFGTEAKKYGVLFTAVSDKTNDSGLCDIIAKQDDVTKLNYIMEKMGYTPPEVEVEQEPERTEDNEKSENPEQKQEENSKNNHPRTEENQQDKESTKRGDMEETDKDIEKNPSVKKKVEDIKEQQAKTKEEKQPEKAKVPQQNVRGNKKSKNKGKSKREKSL